jgi:hypothetical protein
VPHGRDLRTQSTGANGFYGETDPEGSFSGGLRLSSIRILANTPPIISRQADFRCAGEIEQVLRDLHVRHLTQIFLLAALFVRVAEQVGICCHAAEWEFLYRRSRRRLPKSLPFLQCSRRTDFLR